MDKLGNRNPSKSEVIGGDEKTNDHAESTKVDKVVLRNMNFTHTQFDKNLICFSTD